MSDSHSSPSNTLLKRTSADAAATAVSDLLARPAETNLLVVSYRGGRDAWLSQFRSHVGGSPPEVGCVAAGVETRSTESVAPSVTAVSPPSRTPSSSADSWRAPSPTSDSPPSPSGRGSAGETLPVTVPVSDPTDLARVGVRASEYLDGWADGRPTAVVLDSVTAMLDDVGLDRAFGFLHLLAGRVESANGRGYYLVDPSAHDDCVLTVVRELADRVVELDAAPEE